MYQQPPAYGTPVIVTQSPVYITPQFGRDPVNLTCPNCRSRVVTRVIPRNGTCCMLTCGLGVVLSVAFGTGLIPLCIAGCTHICDDFEHQCPCCNTTLGIYKII